MIDTHKKKLNKKAEHQSRVFLCLELWVVVFLLFFFFATFFEFTFCIVLNFCFQVRSKNKLGEATNPSLVYIGHSYEAGQYTFFNYLLVVSILTVISRYLGLIISPTIIMRLRLARFYTEFYPLGRHFWFSSSLIPEQIIWIKCR